MEKETIEFSKTMYAVNSGTIIGITAIATFCFKWLWKQAMTFKYGKIKNNDMGLKEENSELRKEIEKYKNELSEREINSLAEIISTVKTEVEGLKKAFHDNLKEEITDLKNFIEERYTTKENFFLLLQLVGKLVGELSTLKNRIYPTIETAKRDLVDRKVEFVSNDVYNDNTEINNILTTLYQNFGAGKR